jgi:hypothetical protein
LPIIKIDPNARQTASGVTYRSGNARKEIPGAFISVMRSTGHKGVFKRKGQPRLPIKELAGPSLPHIFVKTAIMSALESMANAAWAKNFEHEIQFELSKYR